eukprot:PITA_21853
MNKVVEEYKDIFASHIGVPLHCQVKHSIDLTLGAPLPDGLIYQRSVLENNVIKRQIQELLQKGHITQSASPYGSPIVLEQKKDETRRLYIDISKIELKSGHHKVPLKPSNVWKTVFKSKEGLLEWLVMPFGLMNAPPTFMILMDEILRPFTNSFAVVYLDDILIFSQS